MLPRGEPDRGPGVQAGRRGEGDFQADDAQGGGGGVHPSEPRARQDAGARQGGAQARKGGAPAEGGDAGAGAGPAGQTAEPPLELLSRLRGLHGETGVADVRKALAGGPGRGRAKKTARPIAGFILKAA